MLVGLNAEASVQPSEHTALLPSPLGVERLAGFPLISIVANYFIRRVVSFAAKRPPSRLSETWRTSSSAKAYVRISCCALRCLGTFGLSRARVERHVQHLANSDFHLFACAGRRVHRTLTCFRPTGLPYPRSTCNPDVPKISQRNA